MTVEDYLEHPGPYPLRRVVETQQKSRHERRAVEQLNYLAYRDAQALSAIYVATLTSWITHNDFILDKVNGNLRLAGYEVPMLPVDAQHEHFFSTAAGSPDPKLRAYMSGVRSDTPERWAFMSWYLLYDWFLSIFAESIFGRDDVSVTAVSHPKLWAIPYADVALSMLRQGGIALVAGLAAQMLATTREEPWGPPPWHLNS